MTYSELTTLLQDYLENSESGFVSNLPAIIRQAETRIANLIRSPDQRQTQSITVSAGDGILTNMDFKEPEGVYVVVDGEPVPLLQKQLSFLRTVFGNVPGTPGYYAYARAVSTGATLYFGPVPDISYEIIVDYFGNPPSIVDTNETWLSVQFPECLLYGCLIEGYAYMKGEADMLGVYDTRFKEALEAFRRSAEGLELKDEFRNAPSGILGAS